MCVKQTVAHPHGFDLKSPAAAPSIADEAGVFGEDCLSAASASSAAARFGEKHRKQAVGGSLFFGYFILDKEKKVTRIEAKKKCYLLSIKFAYQRRSDKP